MVEKYGEDWTSIGRAMGRALSDCYRMFVNSAERANTGKFSAEEGNGQCFAASNLGECAKIASACILINYKKLRF